MRMMINKTIRLMSIRCLPSCVLSITPVGRDDVGPVGPEVCAPLPWLVGLVAGVAPSRQAASGFRLPLTLGCSDDLLEPGQRLRRQRAAES
jgi:hypothetical protein